MMRRCYFSDEIDMLRQDLSAFRSHSHIIAHMPALLFRSFLVPPLLIEISQNDMVNIPHADDRDGGEAVHMCGRRPKGEIPRKV